MLLLLYPHSWVFILSQDITDLIISIESETENESNYQRDSNLSEMKKLTFSRHST